MNFPTTLRQTSRKCSPCGGKDSGVAGAAAFGVRRLVAALRPRAQARPWRIRPCREQKRQQAGALQTLARDPGRVWKPGIRA